MKQALLETMTNMSQNDLYEALFVDVVAGTLNRVAFEKCSPYQAIAIIDLDSLKYINDHAGHREGDAHLRYLGTKLSAHFGRDNVYRLSGDEFVVTGDTVEDLTTILEDLQTLYRIFSFGVQVNLVRADEKLIQNKKDREENGDRAPRGEKPYWYGKVI